MSEWLWDICTWSKRFERGTAPIIVMILIEWMDLLRCLSSKYIKNQIIFMVFRWKKEYLRRNDGQMSDICDKKKWRKKVILWLEKSVIFSDLWLYTSLLFNFRWNYFRMPRRNNSCKVIFLFIIKNMKYLISLLIILYPYLSKCLLLVYIMYKD